MLTLANAHLKEVGINGRQLPFWQLQNGLPCCLNDSFHGICGRSICLGRGAEREARQTLPVHLQICGENADARPRGPQAQDQFALGQHLG